MRGAINTWLRSECEGAPQYSATVQRYLSAFIAAATEEVATFAAAGSALLH